MIHIGFQRINDKSNLYVKEGSDKKIVLAKIFVDDTVFTRNDDPCKVFVEEMSKVFGEIKFFVRLHIQQTKMVSTSLNPHISRRFWRNLVWKIQDYLKQHRQNMWQ